jgi:hypothetical protein
MRPRNTARAFGERRITPVRSARLWGAWCDLGVPGTVAPMVAATPVPANFFSCGDGEILIRPH